MTSHMKIGVEMRTYQKMASKLEKNHMGEIAVIYHNKIVTIGRTIDTALKKAEKKYPKKVFFVRKIGKNPEAIFIL